MAPTPDTEQRVRSTKEHMSEIPGPRINIWAAGFEGTKLDDAVATADVTKSKKAIVWGMSDLYAFDPSQAENAKAFFDALGAHNGPNGPIRTVPELLQAMKDRSLPSYQVRPGDNIQSTAMETPDGPALYYSMPKDPTGDIEIEGLQLGTKIKGVSLLIMGSALRDNGDVNPGRYLNVSLVISMS